jgi:hypothetical protein
VKHICFIPACLLVLGSLHAQYFSTVTYTSMDGLPTSELLSVFVDSKGYVWTTSMQGVSRFDGQKFRNFNTENGLASNSTSFVREDADGRIWCLHNTSYSEVLLSIIEGDNIRTINFTKEYGGLQGSMEYNPHTREIWVMAYPGPKRYVYDFRTETFYYRPLPVELTGDVGNKIIVDPFRNRMIYFFFVNSSAEAFLFDGEKVEKLPDPPFSLNSLLYLAFLPDGRILATDIYGISATYGSSGWQPFAFKKSRASFPDLHQSATTVLVRQTERPSVKEVIAFSAEFPDGLTFPYLSAAAVNNTLGTCAKAPDGSFWIASRNGLIRLFPAFLDFLTSEENWYLSDLHALCEDKSGRMWFGSYSYGFSVFDGREVRRGPDDLKDARVLPGSARTNRGEMLFWLESDEAKSKPGLLVFDGENPGSLPVDYKIGFYFSRSYDGQLAFGLHNNQLVIQDPSHDEPFFGKIIGPEKGLNLSNVITAVKDWQGRWWMGRPSSGMALYDPVQDTVYNFLRKDPRRDYGVMSSELDAKGNLWFGTTHGLCFFAPPDLIDPASFDPAVALQRIGGEIMGPSQVNVLKLLDENTLLAGNYKGLALIDLKQFYETGKPTIYFLTQKDGYSGLGVEQNAIWLDSKGYVWVASDVGAHRFDPRLIRRPERLPHFSIDSLRAGVRSYPVTPGKPVRLKSQARFQTLGVHLKAEYDPIRPNHVFFAYKFRNDSAFSAPVQDEVISFPNLAPGRYILQIKLLKDGSESEIQELQIVIPRPLLANPWTYVLIMSLLGAGAWAVQRNRNRQKMEKNKLQVQAIVNQLNPHFINNALQWVQIRVYKDDDVVGVISKLGENIRLVFKNSREKKAFHSLEEEMKLVENYLFIQKKRFTSHLDYELPDEAQVNALGHIMVPLMQIQIHCENAVEHGIRNKEENGFVKVILNDEGDYLRIVIEDSGVGRRQAGEIGSKGTQQGTQMLENLKDIFNSRNPLPIEYRYEDDIFTDPQGEGYGTRVHIGIPKNYRYEFD